MRQELPQFDVMLSSHDPKICAALSQLLSIPYEDVLTFILYVKQHGGCPVYRTHLERAELIWEQCKSQKIPVTLVPVDRTDFIAT